MEKQDTSAGKKISLVSINVSIWLTTLIVVVLILLLALTINHAREKDMVEQFGQQQLTIARGTAGRIDDFLITARKNMITLFRLPFLVGEGRSADTPGMKAVYGYFEKDADFMFRVDAKGVVISGYPPSTLQSYMGKKFSDAAFFEKLRRTRDPYISELALEGKEGKCIAVGIPETRGSADFSGATIAVISAPTIIQRFVAPAMTDAESYYWLVDSQETILAHPDVSVIGKDARLLERGKETGKTSLREAMHSGDYGHGEYVLQTGGAREIRSIVAYAPIHIGDVAWSLAIATPYRTVISLVRKTFVNIMIGAAGLIIAVIVGGMSISRSGRRRLQLDEELKRLRERSDWQEMLIREKKTIEGIIEGSPIPTFVIDREHRVTFWNKACTDLTGCEGREMIGTNRQHLPFYPEEQRPVLADLIVDQDFEGLLHYYGKKRVQRSAIVEGAYEAGAYFENLGGRARHLYFLAAPIYDEKGEIIAAIETLQDVSREEEMDQNLREYAETLQNELIENINLRRQVESLYNYLQSLLDDSPDQLFDLNSDGTINFMSRDLQRGKDLVSPQVKGKNILEFVNPGNRELMIERWNRILAGDYEPYEIEVTAKSGARRNLLITPRPVSGTNRYLLVQRDITEFKNLEDRYYESQKLAAIGQLSAGIAHEIRNPLSSIKMSLQILEKRMQPQGNDLKRFRIAQREVEHLEQLVNDVLIYAKPADPNKEPTEIKKIIEHALAMAEKDITDKQITVFTQVDEKLPSLFVDAAMLAQALLNLCRNAVDAMGEGGKLRISARMAEGERKAMNVEIEDNGNGIDEKDMPYIFNPFFTTKKSGTGLGLTPVKKIVELHQGTIEIWSKKGEGTRVIVTLPFEDRSGNGRPGPSVAV